MLKAGIFLDMENLTRNGGWGMRLDAVKQLVQSQGCVILRANAYMAINVKKERLDSEFREKAQAYRDSVRAAGFHIIDKEVRYFTNEDGTETAKANADLDMAVDTILQSENLDYILLGTGDGDFLRLIRALQNKGKRVDALAFNNVSNELKREVDHYFPGTIVPTILPIKNNERRNRLRGMLTAVNPEKGFGFLTTRTGFGVADIESIFCHISQVTENDQYISNDRFAELGKYGAILEFEKNYSLKGPSAVNATVFQASS